MKSKELNQGSSDTRERERERERESSKSLGSVAAAAFGRAKDWKMRNWPDYEERCRSCHLPGEGKKYPTGYKEHQEARKTTTSDNSGSLNPDELKEIWSQDSSKIEDNQRNELAKAEKRNLADQTALNEVGDDLGMYLCEQIDGNGGAH